MSLSPALYRPRSTRPRRASLLAPSRASLLAAALALTLPAASLGCAAPAAHMSRGELPATGDAEYDAFFQRVHDIGKQAEHGDSDLAELRDKLARALATEHGGPPEALAAAFQRASKLKDAAVLLHLDLVPGAKLTMSGKPSETDEVAVRAVEQVAREALAIGKNADDLAAQALELDVQRKDLAKRAQAAFAKGHAMKPADVSRELAAAEKSLADVAEASDRTSGACAKLALALSRALETGATREALVAEKAKKPGAPVGGPRQGVSAPPPKKPKASDDFEP